MASYDNGADKPRKMAKLNPMDDKEVIVKPKNVAIISADNTSVSIERTSEIEYKDVKVEIPSILPYIEVLEVFLEGWKLLSEEDRNELKRYLPDASMDMESIVKLKTGNGKNPIEHWQRYLRMNLFDPHVVSLMKRNDEILKKIGGKKRE